MTLDLTNLAADIARNIGEEFPAPVREMVQRQYTHLVEEARELVKAMAAASLADIRDELADVALVAHILAHYIEVNVITAEAIAFPSFTPTYPDVLGTAADVAGPLRRYLGIARRSGTIEPVVHALGLVMLTVRQLATNHGVDLDAAITEKAQVVYARGWREVPADVSHSGL